MPKKQTKKESSVVIPKVKTIEEAIKDGTIEIVKKEKVVVPKVKLLTYTLKAVIPTGAYANVQPELTVQSNSLEEANAYLAPHLEKLHKDYFMYLERPKVINVEKKTEPVNTSVIPESRKSPFVTPSKEQPANDCTIDELGDYLTNDVSACEYMSEPYRKAKDAISACKNMEALKMIGGKIEKSVKLNEGEKRALLSIYNDKLIELN